MVALTCVHDIAHNISNQTKHSTYIIHTIETVAVYTIPPIRSCGSYRQPFRLIIIIHIKILMCGRRS